MPAWDDGERYNFVSRMEEIILGKKNKMDPFKFAQQLGFEEPDIFYQFIIKLNREDLIRFEGGKIFINTKMSPVDTNEFLKKFENYLKTGRI